MPRRRWARWPKRFADETNVLGGIVGLLGLALAGAAFVATTNATVQFVALLVAAVTTALTVGLAAYKSVPPPLEDIAQCVGRRFSLKALDNLDPRPLLVGFVGPTRVGKSTLLDHLAQHHPQHHRTETVSVTIVVLQTSPPTYVGILDGAGQRLAQQFRVATEAHALVILADHADSETDRASQPARWKAHEDFSEQLRHHIVQHGRSNLKHIHLLLNKRDRWTSAPDSIQLTEWFDGVLVKTWKGGRWADAVTRSYHSNHAPSDVSSVARILSGIKP